MSDIIKTNTAAKPLGAYPHARRVGNLLFLSGIGPRSAQDNSIPGLVQDEAGNIVSYDIEAECRSVFANVKAVLEASGSSWDKMVGSIKKPPAQRPSGRTALPPVRMVPPSRFAVS
ncbi:MAG: hypothetical protein EOP50_11075, partial [Sphingobacteriales bacterium]